jgi:hypothetical protein
MWVWDWEHAGTDVPVGFDTLNYLFQVAVSVDGASAEGAVSLLRRVAPRVLPDLGVSADAVDPVVTGFLIEMWLRGQRLGEVGGHWHPVIHPGLVRVLTGANEG